MTRHRPSLAALALTGALVVACSAPAARPPEVHMDKTASIDCALVLTPDVEGALLLGFDLHNGTAEELRLPAFQPFLAFELAVRMDGEPVSLVEPQLDIPLNPTTIVVPPEATVQISTPIRVAFDPDVPIGGGRDRMRWSIPRARGPATFEATLLFGERRIGPCSADYLP